MRADASTPAPRRAHGPGPSGDRRPRALGAVLLLVLGGASAGWWWLRDTTPYALWDAPAVDVEIRAEDSPYPEAAELLDEVDLIVRAYVQRLGAGDAEELARLGAPWYTGRESAARRLVAEHGSRAAGPVRAVVLDPVVPEFASVRLDYLDGTRQTLHLSEDDDGVWWVGIGDGDPVEG
ncbi:hypothetical protein ACWD6I_15840 [Streptomyces sp. NPDC002454]